MSKPCYVTLAQLSKTWADPKCISNHDPINFRKTQHVWKFAELSLSCYISRISELYYVGQFFGVTYDLGGLVSRKVSVFLNFGMNIKWFSPELVRALQVFKPPLRSIKPYLTLCDAKRDRHFSKKFHKKYDTAFFVRNVVRIPTGLQPDLTFPNYLVMIRVFFKRFRVVIAISRHKFTSYQKLSFENQTKGITYNR